ncbi:putative Permease of the drug/metabolite transporter (DMT) superfamily [Thiomonas arsenitoxydans]|jgi:drug/metabolite transporter (DMT)-like permease|uniref:Permease of the drug/metabolite transporter (DMT) superfamily n=1 Tax=Thiomonas arsenitoxydans (strain DSM 22701 / CIP 110005 / 3As) TaxID=426114 RepID=D6CLZ2_THIA3|nr:MULTISPECIES: DMT family transporter [Thiomonas]OYV29805.1 MAG: EamA family transporter [Thiomonas sp. 20-64-9]OZB76288.1 MAG: EamA family transporter [Thiomonas sp. 14-64-326]CQR43547.1 putative Permease of the drug/metabolite transporter (DMT) superfamily [Thiomonas sp. CB3]CAZ89570.1 putative Permease of the drug/metabolite transporter (DMT) superfamily [Thiomonas arsenitoxydans]CQR26917.1 putative Permease of the drug/metabolite transporter (DMT) superfamily [Thiomonas arsenitoxydans]
MPSKSHSFLDPSTVLLLTLPPLFWAGNAVVGRLMVGQIPPMALSFYRWLFALLLALLIVGPDLWRNRAVLRSKWKSLAVMGILGVGSYNSLQYVALETTTPLNVSLITSSAPVFILLIGGAFYKQTVGRAQWIGAMLSIAGVALVVAKGDLAHLTALHYAPGDLIMLVAVFLWAIYTWELRQRPLGLAPMTSLAAQMIWGVLSILPFMLAERWIGGQTTHWGGPVWLALAYVAVLPSLLAYWCWGSAVGKVGAQIPSYFGNLAPLFAALLSWLFLGETIHWYHLWAALLIFAGIHVALNARQQPVPLEQEL